MEPTTMTVEQVAMSSGMNGMVILIYIIIYALMGYSLYIIAKKTNEQYPWMAWVPVLNFVLIIRMAKMSLWWILGMFVPIFNIYVIVKVYHNGISKRTGHGGWWTAGLFFFSLIFLPLTAFTYNPETTAVPTPTAE